MHLDGDSVTGLHGTFSSYTLGPASVASQIVGTDARNGRVARWHANASVGLVDAIDPEVLEDGMASHLLDSQCGCEEDALHGC